MPVGWAVNGGESVAPITAPTNWPFESYTATGLARWWGAGTKVVNELYFVPGTVTIVVSLLLRSSRLKLERILELLAVAVQYSVSVGPLSA